MNLSDILRIAVKMGTLILLLMLLYQFKKYLRQMIYKQKQSRSEGYV